MPNPRKILVVEPGMQSLRVAEFATDGERLTLLRGARRELLLDPAMDQSRPDQIRLGLREVAKEWGLGKANASLVLPAHMVFTRVVPLDMPAGLGKRAEEIIEFEARQNIPFPLEEVVWDHAVMGGTPAGAVTVAFVAIRTELLEALCEAVVSAGLEIISISVAPLALYDAFRHTSPELAQSTTLLLDVGSRTTNLVISSPGSFFARNIPTGGLAVTAAIAKELRMELEAAEQLKVSRGSVALGAGFELPADTVEAAMATAARQALLKTQADVSRSLGYYRATLGGGDPSMVLLTGGMTALPYLAEFFAEKLQKEVVFFKPLDGISTTEEGADFAAANAHNLGELVGGALVVTDLPRTDLDLLPPSLARKREFFKRLPWLATAAALVLATLAAWYGFALYGAATTREETSRLFSIVAKEETAAASLRATLAASDTVWKSGEELAALLKLRAAYPALLAELSNKLPKRYLWITEFSTGTPLFSRGGPSKPADTPVTTLVIKGLYLDNPRQAAVIDDFVNALQTSELFAFDEKEKSRIITQRGSPNGEYWAYPFALKLPLRSPIAPLP